MKVLVELDIEGCYECPFAERVIEHGCSETVCSKLGYYSNVPEEGFRKDCPLMKMKKKKTKP